MSDELFSTRIRKATRKVHSVSDALVNAKFAISLRDETVWGGGLLVFYYIFAYLEDAKQHLNVLDLNKLFVHNILYRKKAFEEDLNHYLGNEWQLIPKPQALQDYLQHLQDLEKENPRLLMVYVYHLYLGLLSGGQILAKKRKLLGNKEQQRPDKVTDFAEVDISHLKNEMRSAINEIGKTMSDREQQAFIEESNKLFLLNNRIVDSVSGQNQVLQQMLLKASAVVILAVGVFLTYKLCK